jgi:hypothetical protein
MHVQYSSTEEKRRKEAAVDYARVKATQHVNPQVMKMMRPKVR